MTHSNEAVRHLDARSMTARHHVHLWLALQNTKNFKKSCKASTLLFPPNNADICVLFFKIINPRSIKKVFLQPRTLPQSDNAQHVIGH